MNKALTIEELKALPVGDWVWIVPNSPFEPYYAQVIVHTDKPIDKEFWVNAQTNVVRLYYADYGKTWLAYKNKEMEKTCEFDEIEEMLSVIAGSNDKDLYRADSIKFVAEQAITAFKVLQRDKADLERTIEEINEALKANGITIDTDGNVNDSRVEEAKKQTAKEILQGQKFVWKDRAREYTNWDGNKVQAVTLDWLNADIQEIAEDYGVEVDE